MSSLFVIGNFNFAAQARLYVRKDYTYRCDIDQSHLRIACYEQASKLPVLIQDPCARVTIRAETFPMATGGDEHLLGCFVGRIWKLYFRLDMAEAAFGRLCRSAEFIHFCLVIKLACLRDTAGVRIKDVRDGFDL